MAPRVNRRLFQPRFHIGQNSYRRQQNKEVGFGGEVAGGEGVESWQRAIAHKCDTSRDIVYMLSLAASRNGAGRRAGAEFDQCGVEGIQILTCETPSPRLL